MTTVWITGKPVPQGGLIPTRMANGRIAVRNKPALVDYRDRLARQLASHHNGPPLTTAVSVLLVVKLERPATHYGTGRNSHQLKDSAPPWPTGRHSGDVDKLARTALDALVIAGVLHDDSQVVTLQVAKSWAEDHRPGMAVTVSQAEQ